MSDPVLSVTIWQASAMVVATAGLSSAISRLLAPWRSVQELVDRHDRILLRPDTGRSVVDRLDTLEAYRAEQRQADADLRAILNRIDRAVERLVEEEGGGTGGGASA